MKKVKIFFNRKMGHPVANLESEKNVVLTTKGDGNYRSLKIESEDTIGFDATGSFFTDTIVKDGNTKTFLGFLTKKGKSKLNNFLNEK